MNVVFHSCVFLYLCTSQILDRDLFSPMEESKEIPPLTNSYVMQLQVAYKCLLDETSAYVLKEQEKLRE